MPNEISGVHDGGYFYHEVDSSRLKTAQRSTFNATTSNKISNWFMSKSDGNAQRVGAGLKSLRGMDLALRGKLASTSKTMQRLGVKGSATFQKLRAHGDESTKVIVDFCRDSKLEMIDERSALKKKRHELKVKINNAAPDQMVATIEAATQEFQQHLRQMNYRPLENLSEITPHTSASGFIRHANGHRVRVSDQQLPFIARLVAQSGSHQYDNGVAGVERAFKRGAQYSAIGLSSGWQLGKRGLYSAAAKLAPSASEERATFARRADRARDTMRLNSAALQGNQVFADKFAQIQQEQEQVRNVALSTSGYAAVELQHGVAPASTRYSARKMNDYFGPDGGKTKSRQVAAAYVGLLNLGARFSRSYHAGMVRWASTHKKADAPQMQQTRQYHDAKRFKAQFRIDSSRAALDGKLKQVASHPDDARTAEVPVEPAVEPVVESSAQD